MRRILALVLKDLHQHLGAIAGLGVLGGFGVVFSATVAASRQLSAFEGHAQFCLLFLPLSALVLGNRLVVAEYQGRTQLFLEALPVRRWEMVATKYLFGLTALLALAAGSMALSSLVALARESVEPRFFLFVAARTAGFAFCLWSLFFAMGFTGRWRIPLYLAAFFALSLVDAHTDLEPQKFGPFALVDPRSLPFERTSFPVRALLEALGFGAAWLALGLGLSLVQEGSVAETLARRMSQKEKAVVTTLFFATLIGVVALDERREKEPFDFGEQGVLRGEAAPVHVLYLREERRDEAQALLEVLVADHRALSELLGRPLPAVRVAFHTALDGRTFEKAELRENEGVLVRANFERRAGLDLQGFRAFVVRQVLVAATRGRADFEPRAFLFDGFSRWWSERDAGDPAPERTRLRRRARWASRDGAPTADEVRRWWTVRERLGEPLAEALAWSAFELLEESRGRGAVEQLARLLYGREPAQDLSELWRESPLEADFEAATSVPLSDFLGRWRARLGELGADVRLNEGLEETAGARGELEIVRDGGPVREVRYRFRFESPPPASSLCSLLHLELGPFDEPLEAGSLLREEHRWTEGRLDESFSLPGRYGAGARVFLALECESRALGCPVRLWAERRELR